VKRPLTSQRLLLIGRPLERQVDHPMVRLHRQLRLFESLDLPGHHEPRVTKGPQIHPRGMDLVCPSTYAHIGPPRLSLWLLEGT